jgi:hypothetical protein
VWTRCIMHPVCLWWGSAFRPTGLGVGGGGRRGLLQIDSARHSRITTWPNPALPDSDLTQPGTPGFRLTGPNVGGGGGKGLLQTNPARFFAWCFTSLSLPPPPKTFVTDTKTYWINIYQLHKERAVIGKIFQALPTQTDTTVALIYKIMIFINMKCYSKFCSSSSCNQYWG